MRLAPFALLSLLALPACEPYGYGYSGTYGGPVYGAPAYGSPHYDAPAYAAPPPSGGVFLFGGDRDDRRRYDRGDYGRNDYRRQPQYERQRPQESARPNRERVAAPQPQQPRFVPQAAPQVPQGGGGGGGHSPSFNPANPTAQGDRN